MEVLINNYCMGIQHIGIPTVNIESTVNFYEQLGFNVVLRTQNKNQKVAFLELKNLIIEAYEESSTPQISGAIDHFSIDVTHIEAIFEYLQVLGVKILDAGINQLPFWNKGIKYFTILGPNQEKIEFCEIIN